MDELFDAGVRDSQTFMDVISDSKRLASIRDMWDTFADRHTDNPFMLSGFLEHFMRLARSKGWTPVLLMIRDGNSVIGMAPMMTRRKFGIRYACALSIFHSIVALDEYREVLVSKTLDFVHGELGCQFASVVLPVSSAYIQILKRVCREKEIDVSQIEGMGQSILNVDRTWHELAKSRGKKFLQDIRRTERNLSRVGEWRHFCLRQSNHALQALGRMMCVERMSWKQSYRSRRGQTVDQMLMTLWAGSQSASRTTPNLRWMVWFLEANDHAVAYTFLIEYKGVAFAVKTSYDQQYACLGPGTYLMNTAIRELFEERQVNKIDFISDYSWCRTWASLCVGRVKLTMTSGKGLSRIILALFARVVYRRNVSRILCYSLERLGQASNAFPLSDLLTW